MHTAEIITIGDEILIGQIIDTNSAYIAETLNNAGVKVGKITSVADNGGEIERALAQAEKHAGIVIITGGLGPTNDDITKKVLAHYFGCTHMELHKPTLEFIEKRFARRGIAINGLNRLQAEVPECCTVIPNKNGTAPGMLFEKHTPQGMFMVFSMPGVPAEARGMIPDVIEIIKQKTELPNIFHKTMLTYGIPESLLAQKIEAWEQSLPKGVSLAYLPDIETGVKLRLSYYTPSTNGILLINELFGKLETLLGNNIYGFEPDTLESVAGRLLVKNNATLATAESCTGGCIAHRITSVPGSSEYYNGGVVAYSNQAKINLLGVNPSDIEKYGAVSSHVALQMAEGARAALGADYALSTTGVAGPTGGSAEKPVGLCWFGIATPNGTETFSHNFTSNRAGNIIAAASVAINALRLALLV